MADKFGRNYILIVDGADGNTYTFQYPLTLEFSIDRKALASANTASLRLFNLSANTRKVIYKDCFDVEGTKRKVTLMAGYGNTLSQILYGNIKEAKSFREEGAVNFITEIDCYDWSFVMINTSSEWTLNTPQTRNEVIDKLVYDFTNDTGAARGVISDFSALDKSTPFSKYTASGRTWELLGQETNYHNFVDNGTLHCLLDDDYLAGEVLTINSSVGLLSTPKKSGALLKIDILFEPSIKLGQKINLEGESEPLYNGEYKVIGIQHVGIISGAVNGKCRTSLLLNAGQYALNPVTGEVINTPISLVTK